MKKMIFISVLSYMFMSVFTAHAMRAPTIEWPTMQSPSDEMRDTSLFVALVMMNHDFGEGLFIDRAKKRLLAVKIYKPV